MALHWRLLRLHILPTFAGLDLDEITAPRAVQFDQAAFHLRHPTLRLPQGGGEVALGHSEAQAGATGAAADLLGFFEHQDFPYL